MNYFHHCREVTIEISSTKLPPASQMPNFWEYNHRSLLNYMEQVLYGVRGVVTNSFNDNPVKAKVFIESHDIDESFIYSGVPAGNYNRLLKSGIYSLTFSALGYHSKTVPLISSVDYETTLLDIQLEPHVGFISNQGISINIYPNPATESVYIKLDEVDNYKLSVYDESGRLVVSTSFNGNDKNIDINHLKAGNYLVSITGKNTGLLTSKLIVK